MTIYEEKSGGNMAICVCRKQREKCLSMLVYEGQYDYLSRIIRGQYDHLCRIMQRETTKIWPSVIE
jgi:hypothetical protein